MKNNDYAPHKNQWKYIVLIYRGNRGCGNNRTIRIIFYYYFVITTCFQLCPLVYLSVSTEMELKLKWDMCAMLSFSWLCEIGNQLTNYCRAKKWQRFASIHAPPMQIFIQTEIIGRLQKNNAEQNIFISHMGELCIKPHWHAMRTELWYQIALCANKWIILRFWSVLWHDLGKPFPGAQWLRALQRQTRLKSNRQFQRTKLFASNLRVLR